MSYNRVNVLKNYRSMLLSLLLTTSLSVNSTYASDSSSYYKSNNSFYSKINILNESIKKIDDIVLSFKPENIDFSDFPYSDGSIESKLNIARYIREKVKFIPNSYKYNYVVNHFMFSKDQFYEFYAIIYREGKMGDGVYELAFANTTNVFNRVISRDYCNSVREYHKISGPVSLYQHITAKNQYSPYTSGDYLKYIGYIEEESYQGMLDALFVMDVIPERMHDYLDFRAYKYKKDCVELVPGGNWFRNSLKEDDILPLEERYYYVLDEDIEKEFTEQTLVKRFN